MNMEHVGMMRGEEALYSTSREKLRVYKLSAFFMEKFFRIL